MSIVKEYNLYCFFSNGVYIGEIVTIFMTNSYNFFCVKVAFQKSLNTFAVTKQSNLG